MKPFGGFNGLVIFRFSLIVDFGLENNARFAKVLVTTTV